MDLNLFLFLQKVKNKFNKEFKYIFSRLAQSDGADCYCFFVIMNIIQKCTWQDILKFVTAARFKTIMIMYLIAFL